ncbi:unnamed protein product [Paramecium sonneborni]|uniref:Uncharacterized protein n=1 Tax=Paramecium sonneborni TaxID=65129 RepID=A0A8S1JZE0_9CILI|nr:unnamed protein product [Paramecium sonneborni]
MGAVCQFQQQGSETYCNQEIQYHIPISKEIKPKTINDSIKHDLRAKYLELDCQLCVRPLTKEIAAQTEVTFYNVAQNATLKKKEKNQKKKKKQKGNFSERFDNPESNQCSSASPSSPTQIQFSKDQLQKKMIKYKPQDFQPYVVLVNSQKLTISNGSPQKKKNN